jgi:hypothetical protein
MTGYTLLFLVADTKTEFYYTVEHLGDPIKHLGNDEMVGILD